MISAGCGDASSKPVRLETPRYPLTSAMQGSATAALCNPSNLSQQQSCCIFYMRALLCLCRCSCNASTPAVHIQHLTGHFYVKPPQNARHAWAQPAKPPRVSPHRTPPTLPTWKPCPRPQHGNACYNSPTLLRPGLPRFLPHSSCRTARRTDRIFTMHWSHHFFVLPVPAQRHVLLQSYWTFVSCSLTWWYCILFCRPTNTCNGTTTIINATSLRLSLVFGSKPFRATWLHCPQSLVPSNPYLVLYLFFPTLPSFRFFFLLPASLTVQLSSH